MTAHPALRFAMVTTFYPPHHFGGDAVFIRRLVHALARRGHAVEVIHDADAFRILHPGDEPAALEEPPGVTVHRLESRYPTLSCLATLQLGRPVVHGARIRAILSGGRFDVVHFHNVSLVGGPRVLRYGSGVKLYMAHEHWLVCPSHVLWRHNRELCTGRECIRCQLAFRRPPQLWRYTGLLEREARAVDVFLSPSRFSAEKHRELGFPYPLEVLPYFLPDLESGAEPPAEFREPEDRPYFLFVGRLEKIKGVQDLLPQFGDGAPAELWIAGTGDYEETLRREAAGLPRVRFLGRKSPEELRALYRRALAVVVPSVCYETFGIILLEAFREEVPVLARALGPFTEIVRESGGGLLFESADELRAALHRLAADAPLRAQLARSGHAALRERWTERVVLRQYFDVIRRVARARGLADVLERLPGGDGPGRSEPVHPEGAMA
jgi:glycosyltransferase involved in cell wall biosynthesis